MVCAWTGAQNRSTIKRLFNQNVFITEKTLQRISLFPAIRLFNNHKYEMHAEWVSLINSMWLNRTFLRPNHIAFKWFWFRFHFLTKSEPTPALLRSLSISQRKILSMATQCAAFLWINIKIMLFFFFFLSVNIKIYLQASILTFGIELKFPISRAKYRSLWNLDDLQIPCGFFSPFII